MRLIAWLAPLGAVAALAACGGNVIVDHNTGGAGGANPSGPGPGGPGSNVSSSIGPGQSSTSHGPTTTVSSATGPSTCDHSGDCFVCQGCAIEGPCAEVWNACLQDMSCLALLDCLSNCADQQCFELCWQTFPQAHELYEKLAACVLCEACYNDCMGEGC